MRQASARVRTPHCGTLQILRADVAERETLESLAGVVAQAVSPAFVTC
jgi:hypothetical protein